jgi:hypothetical protein
VKRRKGIIGGRREGGKEGRKEAEMRCGVACI